MGKAISIKQPWAHLIAIGLKDVENRSWPTNYRGVVYIHASAKIDSRFRAMNVLFTPSQFTLMPLNEQSKAISGIYDHGAVIGEVEIYGCVQNSESVWAEKGQYHWLLRNATLYEQPYKNVKGKLSFWDFTPT